MRSAATSAWLAVLAAPVLCAAPSAAVAQATEPASTVASTATATATETVAGDGTASPLKTIPPSAETDPAAAPLWALAVSGGISARDGGPDGNWQTLSLTRRLGRGYVRGTVMRYHGTLLQADTALPSDYYVATLGAGGNFGNWVVDGWASYGRQDYGRFRITSSEGTTTNRTSTGAKGSDYYAVGGDFGRIIPLAGNLYLTPTIAGSFANGRLLRPAPARLDLTDVETDEPTWSANATMRLDYAFGATRSHYIGLSLSRNWTSNGVSALRLNATEQDDGSTVFNLDSKHYADGWFEAGASTSMRLSDTVYLDLFGTRSFGVMAGNITTAGVTLRKSF
jgi:hypothetical protein